MTINKFICGGALVALFAVSEASALTIHFDDLAPGDLVSDIAGVGFSSNIPGFDLVVSTGFSTTSPSNYLGVADGGFESFLGGDEIGLSFPKPATGISASFVSVSGTPGEVFSIVTDVGSVVSGLVADAVLADGSWVFDVSFSSTTPFNGATLTSEFGVVSFNIDDIAIDFPGGDPTQMSAPGTALLLMIGLIGIAASNRCRGPGVNAR